MGRKYITSFLLAVFVYFTANAQNIVIDTSSTSKYLIKKPQVNYERNVISHSEEEEMSFGDRAFSIGKGILNRLKARLNLEEAVESIKEKKRKFTGSGTKENESNDL
ncbi:MAG: hypothetical protein AAGC64_09265 [Bacteroidota bacterium]